MKIVSFGELIMRFSPAGNRRFFQADSMELCYGGAEANVSAALSLWGETVQYVTALPRHALAQSALMYLHKFGIQTDFVSYGEGRMGLYFLEKGHSVRPSAVIYDRSASVFSQSRAEDYDWDDVLSGADAFLFSGITPSLSESLIRACLIAAMKARAQGIPVFFDVNFRPALCDIASFRAFFLRLLPFLTHLIGNEEHLKELLELSAPATDDPARLPPLLAAISEKTGLSHVAVTVRRTRSAHQTKIGAACLADGKVAIGREWELDVVDRVGGGDGFTAGYLYATLHGFSLADTVDFALASGALKHTIENDANLATLDEVKSAMHRRGADVKR